MTAAQEFGQAIKELRAKHRLTTQKALAEHVNLELARTSIANLEAGTRAPAPHSWAVLQRHFPDDVAWLQPLYDNARAEQERITAERERRRRAVSESQPSEVAPTEPEFMLGGHYVLERYDLLYVFRDGRAPREIIEQRRFRATRRGVDTYPLRLEQTDSPDFSIKTEVLWGGSLASEERVTPAGKTVYREVVTLDRSLSRGESHAFMLRHLIEKDPNPSTEIILLLTVPTETALVHLKFTAKRPQVVWCFGPLPDEDMAPGELDPRRALLVSSDGRATAEFSNPEIGVTYGVAWRW